MTGFGSAEQNGCRVEIRSLNHRFLDIYIKAPAFLNKFEIGFRNALKERFSRGKFDVNILITEYGSVDLDINADFVRRIYEALKKLQEEFSIPGELDINVMTYFREMFMQTSQKFDIDVINGIFKQAMEDLYQMRISEGESLTAELLQMADSLGMMNEKIKNLSSKVSAEIKERFNDRLKIILEGKDIDDNHILQEAAIIVARLDISEEIARIESHVKQFKEIIIANGNTLGRKLDFILQELNREVNTITSKSSDYNISSLVIEMKTEIEKMREQVQNIQ